MLAEQSGCRTDKFSAVVKALDLAAFPHEILRMYSDDKDCLSLAFGFSPLLFSPAYTLSFIFFLSLLSPLSIVRTMSSHLILLFCDSCTRDLSKEGIKTHSYKPQSNSQPM